MRISYSLLFALAGSMLACLLGGLSPMALAQAQEHEALVPLSAEPELSRFVVSAVESNPRVRAARAALEASAALRNAAAQPLYNPELSLEARNTDVQERVVGLSQTIDWGGKRDARTRVAAEDRNVAAARYRAVRWDVATELLSAIAGFRSDEDRAELATTRARLMEEFHAIAEQRFQSGDIPRVELDLARLAVTEARIERATAEADQAEAGQGVRRIIPQAEPSQWPELPAMLPGVTHTGAGAAERSLVEHLPEVVAAQRAVQAAGAAVELRQRERRPDPTLSLTGGEEGDESLVSLSFSIPLFVRNSFSEEVMAALAERSRAEESARDAVLQAMTRLASARERYTFTRSAWRDWQLTGQASLESQTDVLRRLWQAGEISTTDYLVQVRQTLDVRAGALGLREALWRAWFEWLRASGQIDAWLALPEPPGVVTGKWTSKENENE